MIHNYRNNSNKMKKNRIWNNKRAELAAALLAAVIMTGGMMLKIVQAETLAPEDILESGEFTAIEETVISETASNEPTTEETAVGETETLTEDQEETFSCLKLQMKADTDLPKAGTKVVYQLDLTNTGESSLTDLRLLSSFSCPKVTQEWQPAGNLELQEETDTALLTLIEPGQTVTLYVTAQLVPEQMNPLTHTVTVTGTNPMDEQHPLAVSEKLELPIQPLTVEFSVQKKADRQMAAAGDTVNYQICIRNTGERTLHSVVTTERFQNEGIQAVFLEQEGITLNENHDKAMISQILPGEAVSLSASVVIPESAAGQELINQVTVLTQETGEKTVTAQSAVQVEEKIQMTQTPIPTQTPQATPEPTATPTAEPTATPAPTAAAAQVQSNTDSYNAPKTGDNSPIEFYLVLSIVSFVLLYPLLILIRAKRNH